MELAEKIQEEFIGFGEIRICVGLRLGRLVHELLGFGNALHGTRCSPRQRSSMDSRSRAR